MAEEIPNSDRSATKILSGSEIVSDFVSNLKNDPGLDKATVEVIDDLLREQRLTPTNLVKLLEELRGQMSI
jgi:hypothetical protein